MKNAQHNTNEISRNLHWKLPSFRKKATIVSMYICSVQPRSLQKTRRYSFSLLQMLEERWTLDLRTAVAHESLGKHMECFASQYFLGYRQPFTINFAFCDFICDCIHICTFICIHVCIRKHIERHLSQHCLASSKLSHSVKVTNCRHMFKQLSFIG